MSSFFLIYPLFNCSVACDLFSHHYVSFYTFSWKDRILPLFCRLLSQLKLCRHTTCWQKVCEGSAKTCHTGLHWAFKVWGGPTGNSNFDTFKIKGNASGKNPTLSLYCACHRLDSLSLLKKPEDTCVAIPVKTCS